MIIKHVFDFNLALSNGSHAWPGGYPVYFVCADGESLSFNAAQENAGLVRDAIISNDKHSGWHVVASDINYENNDLVCADSGEKIECAYGDDDDALPWCAGWNMPGYMPDNEPSAFATFDEAKRYIIGEIKRDEDEANSEEEAENLAAFAEEVNLQSGAFGATCGKYHYWVCFEGAAENE